MADYADRAQAHTETDMGQRIKRLRDQAAAIPEGRPGDCDLCGGWSGRLVNGVCAPCRDKYNLP